MIAAPQAPAKVRFEDVGKTFLIRSGPLTAIEHINLDIPVGSFFVIVGPSGCGKTTLLRMAAGLETPTRGTITIARERSDRPANSMIFQGDSIFPWMNVFDNAAYGLRMRNAPASEIAEVVGHYLDRTGLTKFAKAYPHQLSGGMKQRVSIARAFANDPEVLLMDEPFSALDEQNKTLLQEELLRIWEETKKTVLFITHSVDEAVTLGDRIMVMTAQPGRAKAIIEVPFPRPRKVLELRATPEYGELVYDIWGLLRDEVLAAKAGEAAEAEEALR
ncbi:MAG TPA: ABC transporter ATP-binding protein [Candidatus Lustribacter sp.]|jgi:NitT/TauT family transport system ATP-binding protein|nr:ABC transporter ATP-binding protein [Candidatus Lustribacter sp.]